MNVDSCSRSTFRLGRVVPGVRSIRCDVSPVRSHRQESTRHRRRPRPRPRHRHRPGRARRRRRRHEPHRCRVGRDRSGGPRHRAASASSFPATHRRRSEIDRVVGEVAAGFGRIDILVNNAGVDAAAPAIDYTEADFDFVLDVNLKAYFFFAQAVAKVMIANGGGAIVSNSSICGEVAVKNISAYNISKGGVNMLTKIAGARMGAARHPRQRLLPCVHGSVHARRGRRARRSQGAGRARSHATRRDAADRRSSSGRSSSWSPTRRRTSPARS